MKASKKYAIVNIYLNIFPLLSFSVFHFCKKIEWMIRKVFFSTFSAVLLLAVSLFHPSVPLSWLLPITCSFLFDSSKYCMLLFLPFYFGIFLFYTLNI